MISYPVQYRRHRHRERGQSVLSPPPPPPPAAVTVVSVTVDASAYGAVWEFSGPVTLVGTDAPELEIDGEGLGFTGPDSVSQVGPALIRGDYSSSSGIEIGNAWRVLVAPSHVSPAIAVPQSGEVM